MKQLSIILFFLTIAFQTVCSQSSPDKIESFRKNVLPQYSGYFSAADLLPGGQLKLSAVENYNSLSGTSKKVVMDNLVKAWQESLISVQSGTKRELWGWNSDAGKALLIEDWDLNEKPPAPMPASPPSKTALHPWFVYLGGQEQVDSHKNINMGLNTRVGFFLLLDRWDLAATFSGFMMGNIDSDEMNSQISSGIMSKVYFPIKKLRISPNVGGELSWTNSTFSDTRTSSLTPYFLTGISWYVGSGSFDAGVRTGKQSVLMFGYTFIPKPKVRNR
ncbi:MAG: hypothetical protein WAL29_13545 [Bacteroidales bacterium]